MLGCFLFSEDDAFKRIGVLSGGERNRYALARMLLAPSNFLLLDEPTNHLDMRAKDVLLDALSKYNGTVVLVSHDRYFIDNLATRIFEIEDGHVHVFPGNYEDYLWRKQGGPETLAQSSRCTIAAPVASRDANGGRQTRQSHETQEGSRPVVRGRETGGGAGVRDRAGTSQRWPISRAWKKPCASTNW